MMIATVAEIGYYLSTLLGFYGYLIPKIGKEIKEKCIEHRWCQYQLKNTIFNYKVDLSDGQWREFRESLPLLFGTAILGVFLHSLFRRLKENTTTKSLFKSTHFHFIFGSVVIFVQHGWHSCIVFLIVSGAYLLTKALRHIKGTYFLVITFVYAMSIILLKESYRVQHRPQLEFLQILFNKRYSGLYSWHVPANFLVLRIISFMLDYHWASAAEINGKKNDDSSGDEGPISEITTKDTVTVKGSKFKSVTEKLVAEHCAMHEYNLVNFLSYCIYAPLYIAGPIITFNAYIKYSNQPQKSENVVTYALRWIFAFCLMELGISYFPFFAIINTGTFGSTCSKVKVLFMTPV
jgi:protein-cysteine N-palmitoyltransferase HHAT